MLPLTEAEGQVLIRLARQALEEGVHRYCLSEIEPPPGVLSGNCGAFVTLHKAGELRGCIGYVEATKPLYQTVRECALAAGLYDPRFDPVRVAELPALRLEISVLSALEDILPEQIEVGRHGLVVSIGLRRGLLLPQVATHYNWDRMRLLEEVCLKAGLPRDAWQNGARIQAFTARVFAEPADLANPAPGPALHPAPHAA